MIGSTVVKAMVLTKNDLTSVQHRVEGREPKPLVVIRAAQRLLQRQEPRLRVARLHEPLVHVGLAQHAVAVSAHRFLEQLALRGG